MHEGLILTWYYERPTQDLPTTNDQKLRMKNKLSNVAVCIEGVCIYMTVILVQDIGRCNLG